MLSKTNPRTRQILLRAAAIEDEIRAHLAVISQGGCGAKRAALFVEQ